MNLFVAGLPYDLDDDELMEIFEKFGPVNSANAGGRIRGSGKYIDHGPFTRIPLPAPLYPVL